MACRADGLGWYLDQKWITEWIAEVFKEQAPERLKRDGDESCDDDPCAIARELAAAKPLLTINVVDIGNSGAGNCLALAGRGRVFTARTAA